MNPYREIIEARSNGDRINPELAEWAADFLIEHYRNGKAASEFLNQLRTKTRYDQRDELIGRVYELVGYDIKRLSRRLRSFELGRWKIWKDQGLSEDADDVMTALYEAFSIGLKVPTTAHHLKKIVGE